MARGVLEHTRLKGAIKDERRYRAAYATVQAEQEKKKILARAEVPFKTRLEEKFLEMIEKIDPLELAAIGALTITIKPVIEQLPEAIQLVATGPSLFGIPSQVVEAVKEGNIFTIKNPFTGEVIWSWTIGTEQASTPDNGQSIEKQMQTFENQVKVWAISYLTAFMLIRHGGDILTIAKSFLKVLP